MAISIQSAVLVRRCELLYLVLACCVLFAACNPRETPIFKKLAQASDREITARTEEAIRNDPELQKLSELCDSIPRPADAELIKKSGGESRGKRLSFVFLTMASFEELNDVWELYFSANEWEVIDRDYTSIRKILRLTRNGNSIEIQYGGMGGAANLGLSCRNTTSF